MRVDVDLNFRSIKIIQPSEGSGDEPYLWTFVFKLDPATGLLARVTNTFGPSFAERAMTAGEGQVSIGATFSSTNYDKLSKFALNNLPLGRFVGTTAANTRTGTGDFHLSSKTLTIAANVGLTPKVDVAVIVPLIKMTLCGNAAPGPHGFIQSYRA